MAEAAGIQKLFRVAFAGLGVSFLGSLPLGTIVYLGK